MAEIREGSKWYYEMCDILLKFFGKECCYYRGFERCTFKNGVTELCGVFELDMKVCYVSKEFLDYISKYSSNHIKGIGYYVSAGVYRNCVICIL